MYTLQEKIYNQYDTIPVCYCKHCLSLNIRNLEDSCYCDNCGSTDILEDNIFDWEEKYELKYKHKYINNYARK